jgi:hypothetical protein
MSAASLKLKPDQGAILKAEFTATRRICPEEISVWVHPLFNETKARKSRKLESYENTKEMGGVK